MRLPATATCLEVGAGLGRLARWIAADLAPGGEVLATEIRPELAGLIEDPALPNLRALRHDVRTDALPPRHYDLIFTRYVLEHLPDRDMVLPRLVGNLKPGGRLVVEDAVFEESTLAGPAAYRRAMLAFAAGRRGTDYGWARSLPPAMTAAGLLHVCAQHVQDVFQSGSELALFFASVLLQEQGTRHNVAATCAGDLREAIALLVGGSMWFSGPLVVQCAGQAGEKEKK